MKALKNICLVFTLLAAAACSQNDMEAKKAKLAEKAEAFAKLKEEIKVLEGELAAMDTTKVEKPKTPVQVKKIGNELFKHYVKITGTVTSKENILISAEANGKVKSISGVEGRKVSAGTVLVNLDSDMASATLREAKSRYDLAKITFEKRKNLWDQKIGSEIEFLQAEASFKSAKSQYENAQKGYDNTIIKSPISGTLDIVSVKKGELVSIGAPIARVVDLDKIEVEANLSEQYLASIKKGDSVRVEIAALGIEKKALVSFVSQVINPENRSFTVKINIPNKDGKVKPNVLAKLFIKDYENTQALVVPSNCINKDLKGDFVYVTKANNGIVAAHKKYITMGKSSKDDTEVANGLEEGDQVVTAGFNLVNEGEIVNVK